MKEPVDWVRAVFSGAIIGGVLWAIMVKMLSVITHEHMPMRDVYTFLPVVSSIVLIAGIVVCIFSRHSFWRSIAVGIILAPLTGWSILLFVTLTMVLPSHWMH
ncbi:hypothetical protein OQ968_10375 [Mycobacterium sp. 663a-19]|uniref:hypothetical protein n=1 Tax=Mycobacterium sp. 663a-19 TaxID=2986148 RepID=UPI002D1EDBC4|nr:hypothetical protein [Mycobacterium sp. 663a-19]MEB3981670.1 hypothetical protein [Mycobacterium sp. 663a-19]